MTQNNLGYSWPRDEIDEKLQVIMRNIHEQCVQFGYSEQDKRTNYARGANIAGFKKVADAMLALGI